LYFIILMGPIQPEIFYDFMILRTTGSLLVFGTFIFSGLWQPSSRV